MLFLFSINDHSHLVWVSSIREDVQQIRRRDEVKPGEGQTLGVQVFCQSFFTQRQPAEEYKGCEMCVKHKSCVKMMMADNSSPALDVFQFTKQTRCIGGLHHVGRLISSICQHFEISINPFKAFGVLQMISTASKAKGISFQKERESGEKQV